MIVVLALTLSLWAALQVVPNAVLISQANSGDLYLGYAGPRWTGSEILQYARENPMIGKVYRNHSHFLYIHDAGPSDRANMPTSQYGEYDPTAVPGSGQEQLNQWLAYSDDNAYIVWFNRWRNIRRYDYGAANFRATPELEPVAELSDGVIYRVNRDYVPPANPYISAYQGIADGDYGEPAARSDFDIYLDAASMIYVKQPCYPDDFGKRFSLNVFPADPNDLPAHRRGWASEWLDFAFPDYGLLFDDLCLAIVPLPSYEIARFSTGQYVSGYGYLWHIEQDYVPPSSPYQTAYDAIISGGYGEPETQATFDVYRNGNELIYLKEPCAATDTKSLFFLHLYPANAADLPAQRREYGFESLDFPFPQYGVQWAGKCLAIVPLPNYEITRIRTGQYIVGGEQIWKAEQYIIDGNPVWRVQQDDLPPSSPYQMTYNAIASGDYGQPEAGGVFDVYRNGNELIYLKEPCTVADTEARFYLHLYPADTANLPAERREYGFDNPDFQFPQHGVRWAGRCLAIVPLPGYAIARIRTGQYIVGGEAIWQVDLR